MNKRPRILSIVGARPQFIKLAPLATEIALKCQHRVVHTGQHYDDNMSGLFFRQLGIKLPDFNLGIRKGTHGVMTGRMLVGLEKTLMAERPDLVVVYGDTNTTLAGTLAASKLGIAVAHVEAGMRSFVADMPEEINRRVADHLSDILLCATKTAMGNLKKEGIRKNVVYSGDLMYELLAKWRPKLASHDVLLRRFKLEKRNYHLITVHRAANVDSREALTRLIEVIEVLDRPTIFPIHPRTASRLRQFGLYRRCRSLPHVMIAEPFGYRDLLTLARFAHTVLTDSGGLQKEAVFLKTPVLTLRDETEWPETLRCGNHLAGMDAKRVSRLLKKPLRATGFSYLINRRRPSKIITKTLLDFLKGA